MDIDYGNSINEFKINMFEYCTLVEDVIIPDDKTAIVKIHKLMQYCSKGEHTTTDSAFINDEECKPKVDGSISTTDGITISIMDCGFGPNVGEPIYSTAIDQEGTSITIQTGIKLPKGSKMIVLFMDNNINDAYLTPFILR